MPKLSRPRERLENDGEKALSTHELLAILLRTGPKDSSAVDLSMSLLASFEDLYYLKTASLEELMCVNGIGRTKAIEIRAAIELGSRIALATQEKKVK